MISDFGLPATAWPKAKPSKALAKEGRKEHTASADKGNVEIPMTTTPPSPDIRRPPLPPCPPQAGSAAPLTPTHLDQLAHAKLRAKKVHKAGGVAMVNGYLLAMFSGGSFLFAGIALMFGEFDVIGILMGVGLALIAWNEFRGRTMLRRFDVHACRVLGWNQLGLMALVIGYAAWMLGWALWGPPPYADAMADEPLLAGPLGSINELYTTISLAIYGGLIAGTLIFQGFNARYYFTRRKHVEAYLRETPEWVVQLQQRGITA
jgi:hypothetical protein